jgi:hypothetical protein
MTARLRTSSDHQRVSVKSPSSFKQRLFDGANNEPNRRAGPNSSLQLGNALAHVLRFARLSLFLDQLDGQIGFGGLDGVNNVEVAVRFRGSLMGIAEHSFCVLV